MLLFKNDFMKYTLIFLINYLEDINKFRVMNEIVTSNYFSTKVNSIIYGNVHTFSFNIEQNNHIWP